MAPLDAALGELREAQASGDADRIAAAGAAVDRLCDQARATARPDFAGGARGPAPMNPRQEWNDTLRRQAWGLPY